MKIIMLMSLVAVFGVEMVTTVDAGESNLYEEVERFVTQRESEFDQISAERKRQLEELAEYVKGCHVAREPVKLTFICTHNSRRSHMSQLWAAVAAIRYGIDQVETFSGGTESTAFNLRAVAAMKRAGFEIENLDKQANTRYQVAFANDVQPLICFSKVYSDEPNPSSDFCAVLTCSDADEKCPSVSGAAARIAIPFEDPKVADNTFEEVTKYDERAAQIAREMLYAFSQVK